MSVKSELRKALIAKRKSVENKEQKDREICRRLTELEEYKNAKTVLLYAALPDEVNCDEVISAALSEGKKVALPKCLDKNGHMKYYFITSTADLKAGSFSLREPDESCKEVTDFSSSICVVPAVCFDKKNYRLGYGGGYYDRFLKNFFYISVGLCYNELIQENLPADEYDIPVSLVITD